MYACNKMLREKAPVMIDLVVSVALWSRRHWRKSHPLKLIRSKTRKK